MSLDTLAQGRLVKPPEQRTASNGRTYALAQVAVTMEERDALASVIAFRPEAVAALLALDKGDAVAVAGRAKVGVWHPREGEPRASLSITVDAVLSAYAIRRKRAAAQGDGNEPDAEARASADRSGESPHAGRNGAGARARAPQEVAGVGDLADDLPWPDGDPPR